MGVGFLIAAVAHPVRSQLCLLAALGGFVSHAGAQPAAPAADKAEPLPPIFTEAPAANNPGSATAPAPTGPAATLSASPSGSPPPTSSPHAISSELAATISTALPQYQDPSANPAPAAAPDVMPRNQVPRLPIMLLPQVTVHEKRIREFTERESYTKKGLEELAVKRYLSDFDRYFLNRFTLPIVGISKEDRAMQLFDQDEAIARGKEEAALWKLDAIKDPDLKDIPAGPAAPDKAP